MQRCKAITLQLKKEKQRLMKLTEALAIKGNSSLAQSRVSKS